MTTTATATRRITELHAAHGETLLRYLVRLTHGERHTAEDLLQDTLLRAWQHADTLPTGEDSERRWLFTVARHRYIDTVRSRRIRPTETPVLDMDWMPGSDDTGDLAIAGHAIRQAFKKLGNSQRDVLTLLHLEGRDVQEVAERLRIPVGTVKSRAHYAMRALRRGMESTD